MAGSDISKRSLHLHMLYLVLVSSVLQGSALHTDAFLLKGNNFDSLSQLGSFLFLHSPQQSSARNTK